jgi:VIT1/CCC1 family predicted Fe2+/Mn2+ transporter
MARRAGTAGRTQRREAASPLRAAWSRTVVAEPHPGEHHRDVRGGAARAAVFGVSDGLVTNLSLILGVAGAHPSPGVVRLSGLAGLVAGACSMAAGEYVSMRAQRELFERELDLERVAIRHRPEAERRELARLYESRGLDPETAAQLATAMMADPEVALDTHAREELGIDPSALGSPVQAAGSSFVTFALGALVPLLPWFFARGWPAVAASAALVGLAAVLVGLVLAAFTGRSKLRGALRQLLLSTVSAGVTFAIGSAVGATGMG